MKRVFCVIMLLLLCISPVLGQATPQQIDLETMTIAELLRLKDAVNKAITIARDWREINVSKGVYLVGQEIPEGHWNIAPVSGGYAYVAWGDALDESGKGIGFDGEIHQAFVLTSERSKDYENDQDITHVDFDMKTGHFLVVRSGDVVLTPYAGVDAPTYK